MARREADPRYLGQAQAVLMPWWNAATPPMQVLILRATIRQSGHEFSAARADLEQAVSREPRHVQAWLTLATIQLVTGELAASRLSCDQLRNLTAEAIYIGCHAAINTGSGQAKIGYDSLANALRAPLPADLRAWLLGIQAEAAERLGRYADADILYKTSLRCNPYDSYTIGAYADYLLDQGRNREVLTLIPESSRADLLQLRRALAAANLHDPIAQQIVATLDAKYSAAKARGDRVHLREESRFRLHLGHAPDDALRLASENWRQQKEAADVRVLLEAAVAARNRTAAKEAIAWISQSGLEGEALARLVSQGRSL
jgi:hypothetical protein